MIYQEADFLEILAGIVSAILETISPFVIPIGEWMIGTIEYFLQFFPHGNYTWDDLLIYLVIFVIIIIIGILVNSIWPGDKAKFGKGEGKSGIDESIELCSECDMPCDKGRVCAYCGQKN